MPAYHTTPIAMPCSCARNCPCYCLRSTNPDPPPLPAPTPTVICRPLCQRIRFVVLCLAPYAAIPGIAPNDPVVPGEDPELPPPAGGMVPISAGMPWSIRIAGSKASTPVYTTTDLPETLYNIFGRSAVAKSKSIVFDFSVRPSLERVGEGRIVAVANKNCAQASLKFRYTWCSAPVTTTPPTCCPPNLPRFEIIGCLYQGMRFLVLDDTTFISSNPCQESVVVLGVQQWCGDAPGQAPETGFDPYLTACNQGVLPCSEFPGLPCPSASC